MTEIDLRRYGAGVYRCRGALQSWRPEGERLLLMFGARHSVNPFIMDALLNVLDLEQLGVVGCVGVEGHPGAEVPGSNVRDLFASLQKEHAGDEVKLVEGMLRGMKTRDYHFWKILALMRPQLKVESVDDAALCERAASLEGLWGSPRHDYILARLRGSDLFEGGGDEAAAEEREKRIQAKAALQWEQEWCEHEANVARDGKMVENLMALWERSGREKVAILNAGSSHLWRIARALPEGVGYHHIEQP